MMDSSLAGSWGFHSRGGAGVRFKIPSAMTPEVLPEKARWLVAISYRTKPKENRSVRESSSSQRTCSGDINAMVPRAAPGVVISGSWLTVDRGDNPLSSTIPRAAGSFARPKSRILAWPREVMNKLAGLISRCTIPTACAASSASEISIPNLQEVFGRQRLFHDALPNGVALEILHRDVTLFFMNADVINRADVGVIERRSGTRLAFETLEGDPVTDKIRGQKFERHKTVQPCVTRLVNDTHAPTTHLGDHSIVGNFRKLQERTPETVRARVGIIREQPPGNLESRGFDEIFRASVELEQGFHFTAKFLVAAALRIEKSAALWRLMCQRAVKEFLGAPPVLRGHFALAYSIRAATRLSPSASHGPPFPWRLSAPRRSPPRSNRQKSGTPRHGFFSGPRRQAPRAPG